MKDTHNHKFDYSHITKQIIVGSDLCEGEHCPIHSDDFKRLGVCVELNLKKESKEIPPDEMDAYVWIPVEDKTAPSPDQFNLGTVFINQAVENGETVYVHCRLGHGRAPTMVSAYFIRYQNMSVEEAIKKIEEKRDEIHIEDEQFSALKEFEKKWSK